MSPKWAVLSLSVLALAACAPKSDGKATEDAPAVPSSQTLAATLKGEGGFAKLDAALNNAGLDAVLEGTGPYTVFAPGDAAFTAAGDADFSNEALKAQSAALLRAHIVPGALTRDDIAAAVDRGGAEGAQMRTMADGVLTFTRDGDAIVVTAGDGAKAKLMGEETLAANGVLQPIDGLLVKPAS